MLIKKKYIKRSYLRAVSSACKAGLKTKPRLLPWGQVGRQRRVPTCFLRVSGTTGAFRSTFDKLPGKNTQLQKRLHTNYLDACVDH